MLSPLLHRASFEVIYILEGEDPVIRFFGLDAVPSSEIVGQPTGNSSIEIEVVRQQNDLDLVILSEIAQILNERIFVGIVKGINHVIKDE